MGMLIRAMPVCALVDGATAEDICSRYHHMFRLSRTLGSNDADFGKGAHLDGLGLLAGRSNHQDRLDDGESETLRWKKNGVALRVEGLASIIFTVFFHDPSDPSAARGAGQVA